MLVLVKSKIRTLIILIVALMITACAGTPPTQAPSSYLDLKDSLVAENTKDIKGLYESWIMPFNTRGDRYIPNASSTQRSEAESAVRKGFDLFCSASDGTITHQKERYGDQYRCSTPDGVFIGEFTTKRIKGDLLKVDFDSPESFQRREARLKAYTKRKAKNGPTGVITTDEGRFEFLRIGNLNERHVLEIILSNKPRTYARIEEITRIDFPEWCCDLDLTLRDGRTLTVNVGDMVYRTSPNSISGYGYNEGGGPPLPVVIVDKESGQPYTRIFEKFRGIQSLLIENDSAVWEHKSAVEITTTFNPTSPALVKMYTDKLRMKARKLHAEAIEKGWVKLLPEGKLTSLLSLHLKSELNSITRYPNCQADVYSGFKSLENPLHCHAASREIRLITKEGYSLVPDIMPLSTIIVFNKIKSDLDYR